MHYHDREYSPSYDSQPEDLPQQKQRVRGGTRKVVGDVETKVAVEQPIHIDFGQTLRLTPENSRPSTAAGNRSLLDVSRDGSSGRRSPFDSLGQSSSNSYMTRPLALPSPIQTPEKQSPSDRPSLTRVQSYAWRPRNHVEATISDGLNAEDFVQQRAAMAMQPQGYVTQRALSSGRIDQLKGGVTTRPVTPPSPSPRKLQKRPSSRQSRGSAIDYSAHLSAREQEVVARITGGPLLNNVNNRNRTPDPNVGLIGAIEARDLEKENIKKGLQSKMLQAAIDQRHRESRTAQIQNAQQHRRTQSQYMAQHQYQQQHHVFNPYSQPTQQMQPVPSRYWDLTGSQQDTQLYRQSMYSLQQQQALQMVNASHETDIMAQSGYSSRPFHQRSQTSYSQYGGFHGLQR